MRHAVLDIGTNTVKILAADVYFPPKSSPSSFPVVTPIYEDAVTTRIGEGVHANRRLDVQAIARTLKTIESYVAHARKLGAQRIVAFATSAVRDAANGRDFLDAVMSHTGIPVKTLSGDEEAQYAFGGVVSDPLLRGKMIHTIDIGGGSTEICWGDANGLQAHKSLDLGAVRLTEMFCKSDPMSEHEFKLLKKHIADELRQLPKELHPEIRQATQANHETESLFIATGGTAVTLAAIDMNHKEPQLDTVPISVEPLASKSEMPLRNVDHYQLRSLAVLTDWLRKMPLAERKKVRGLPPARADIIVAGAAILNEAMAFYRAKSAVVSVRGVRYGALVLGAADGSVLE